MIHLYNSLNDFQSKFLFLKFLAALDIGQSKASVQVQILDLLTALSAMLCMMRHGIDFAGFTF